MDILAIICALFAVLSLVWMGWIDYKLWILPNELVAFLACLALPFHFAIGWLYGGWLLLVVGGLIGGGALWCIRHVANKIYGFDTLGFGDIKLMAAVGLWLGPEAVLMALSLGAFCGVLHALILAIKTKSSLNQMMLPAGPGFIAGSLIVAFYNFGDLIL